MKDEPISIESENIFPPEEPKEPTFDDILEEIPEPMAHMMKGMETLMGRIAYPYANFVPPKRIYKVRVFRFAVAPHQLEEQMEEMLNSGWALGDRLYSKDFVICVFSREQSNKEDSTND